MRSNALIFFFVFPSNWSRNILFCRDTSMSEFRLYQNSVAFVWVDVFLFFQSLSHEDKKSCRLFCMFGRHNLLLTFALIIDGNIKRNSWFSKVKQKIFWINLPKCIFILLYCTDRQYIQKHPLDVLQLFCIRIVALHYNFETWYVCLDT